MGIQRHRIQRLLLLLSWLLLEQEAALIGSYGSQLILYRTHLQADLVCYFHRALYLHIDLVSLWVEDRRFAEVRSKSNVVCSLELFSMQWLSTEVLLLH